VTQIPECVAAGYVDMATGMLLAVNTVDSHPQEVLDTVSAATALDRSLLVPITMMRPTRVAISG
jgi:hypothetical protein